MYTGILHTHKLVVTLFLIYYLVRTILLLSNKHEALDKLTKKLAIPDRIISALFLATGIYLAVFSGTSAAGSWLWVKLIAVFASIPLAVIGFKKKNKALALLSWLLLAYAYGISETKSPTMNKKAYFESLAGDVQVNTAEANMVPGQENYDIAAHGQALYAKNCQVCHGEDGKLGKSGAKDLAASQKTRDESRTLIEKGKNAMPGFAGYLSEDEIMAVNAYIHTKFIQGSDLQAPAAH